MSTHFLLLYIYNNFPTSTVALINVARQNIIYVSSEFQFSLKLVGLTEQFRVITL